MKTFTATLRIGLGSATVCALAGFAFRDAGQPGAALAAAYCGVAALAATAALAAAQIVALCRCQRSPR